MSEPITCINQIRKIIDKLWHEAQAKGRCWGLKNGGTNPMFGSHITLFNESEMVTVLRVRIKGKNIFRIRHYKEVDSTELGEKIKKQLDKKGVETI